MLLDLKELEHGDGEWENIPDIVRATFKMIYKANVKHDEQMMQLEQRITRIEENDDQKADMSSFQRQQQQLEKVALSVNTISEELRIHAQSENEHQLMVQQWQDDFVANINAMDDRWISELSETKVASTKVIAKIERRLELLEEELSHLVGEIDRKVDAEHVDKILLTQRKFTEDAVRKRCKKSAVDKELLGIYQHLSTQHAKIREETKTAIEEVQRVQNDRLESKVKTIADRMEDKYKDLGAENNNYQVKELESLRVEMNNHLSQLESEHKMVVEMRLEDMQKQYALAREHELQTCLDETRREIMQQLDANLQSCKDAVDKQWEPLQRDIQENLRRMDGIDRIENDQTILRREIDMLQLDVERSLQALDQSWWTRQQEEMAQFYKEMSAKMQEIREDVMKSGREKKLKQQLLTMENKMTEMDQMMKLVGKQLIQNTSQLRLVQKEQQEQRLLQSNGELLLMDDADIRTLGNENEPEGDGSTILESRVADSEDDLIDLRSQHQSLQDTIQDTLRQYHHVLHQSDVSTT